MKARVARSLVRLLLESASRLVCDHYLELSDIHAFNNCVHAVLHTGGPMPADRDITITVEVSPPVLLPRPAGSASGEGSG